MPTRLHASSQTTESASVHHPSLVEHPPSLKLWRASGMARPPFANWVYLRADPTWQRRMVFFHSLNGLARYPSGKIRLRSQPSM
jgi:hypothetical protein